MRKQLLAIRQSVADSSAGTVYVPLDGSAKVVLVDNSKSFADVPASDWASDAAAFVSSRELMSGDGSGDFSPNDSISREQLAVMFYRYADSPVGFGTTLNFSDAGSVSGCASEVIAWAVSVGVMNGKGGGILDPQSGATRAEAAQMLLNFVSASVK